MEIADSPMGERQRRYRAMYRERVTGWYNGYLHAILLFAPGTLAISIYIASLANIKWWEWLVVPVVFLGAQWVEYFIHRFLAHRPSRSPFWRLIYVRHTLMHHQFFTAEESRFATHLDWRVTLFPPFTLVVFTLLLVPPSLLAGWFLSSNVGWLIIATGTGNYLFYELLHFCCHIDDNLFVRHCPIVNTARRHHTAHHEMSIMMERNMGIVFPFWDWAYGTSDLDRGLLGHLFNGYSTRYIKKDMRRTVRTPYLLTRHRPHSEPQHAQSDTKA
ncbi:sterol desaturase family protein [Noviherbaspirillum sp. CPCC 100848]|jgi:hypothetical protein|uniref:Sterol desaturase family protein n=1 Tax=Noviherbaspirillum album TaxID=3080276 RepID=A0ABU6J3Y2_9BURK|nr:sterol desaturase family protein [Noviherbaspirillum sp. CPCC 100848]MEC4718324.1 sterol desaturase family protein [Noviherbaspirillum sp. CPCC 100848]